MKYIFFVCIFLFVTNFVTAAEDRQPKTVSGKVRYPNLTVAKNIPVQISCKSTTIHAVTNINGNYSVPFGNLECEQFNTVQVQVNTGEYTGSASREVTFALNQGMAEIILSPAVATSVPEFGTLSAIMAGSVSLLAYTQFKKK